MNHLFGPRRLAPAVFGLAALLATPARAEPPPAFIEFVSPASVQAQRPQPQAGVFVLDLDGLESADAAQTLVDSWRSRRPAGEATVCWLRGRDRGDLLVAARLLTQGPAPSCGKVLLGLR